MANRFSLIVAAALGMGCQELPVPMEGPAPCEVTVDPGEAWEAADLAAERLYVATGCTVTLAAGSGVPVLVGEAHSQEGDLTCGATAVTFDSAMVVSRDFVELDDGSRGLDCTDPESTLVHEFIHLLMQHPGYPMPENAGEHAESGAFQPRAKPRAEMILNASTLTVLCTAVACPWFDAETLDGPAVPQG